MSNPLIGSASPFGEAGFGFSGGDDTSEAPLWGLYLLAVHRHVGCDALAVVNRHRHCGQLQVK